MRLGDVEDLVRRAGLDELVEHLARRWRGSLIWLYSLPSENVPAPPSPNCTFDSGSSTPLAPEAPGVLGALAHHLAALEDERPEAHLRQDQRGEQAARAEADDDRPRPAARAKSAGAWATKR